LNSVPSPSILTKERGEDLLKDLDLSLKAFNGWDKLLDGKKGY
jgi:hypothetical protein